MALLLQYFVIKSHYSSDDAFMPYELRFQ